MKKLAVLITLAALAACSRDRAREAAPGVSMLEGFTMAETAAGASRWRLEAASGRLDEKKGRIDFASPRIKFYTDDKVSSEVTSSSGTLLMQSKDAELDGSVEVTSASDGMRLLTSRLFYASAKGKIWTDAPVTILRGRTVIKGRGFTANPDLSEIEIQHQETRMAR